MRAKILLAAAVVLLALTGCSTLDGVKSAKGSGQSQVYCAEKDTVWRELPNVLNQLGLNIKQSNESEGYVLAQAGITLLSYGENIAIFVDSDRQPFNTKVEVISKRALATNFTAANTWELEILSKLGAKFDTCRNVAR
jgi:RecA-family ATPase